MNETTYESTIKTISSNEEVVFAMLSNLSNLEKVKDRIPQEKVKDMSFDADSLRFKVDGLGEIGFRIVNREPYKTIKFESEHIPLIIHFWVQLKQVADHETRLKLTLKADIPPMIKMMVDSKIKQGIEQMADMLTMIPYGVLNV